MDEIQDIPKRSFRDKVTGVLVWWGFVEGDYPEWDDRIEDIDFDLEPGNWRFDEDLQEWVPYP
ncbi:hypothetical protein [Herbaspirillum rubrisubalbicans]|uniref:Uncharacterized protein n=1 Tax=Herbaspirillum rubrisubalbicans TaxID=80842 RepID=A0AAD0U5Y6_9BURK|nr:hypothetical protein [Herbaspirillum rubrisubalbicans]AYR23036.1 hypothetical protein RC54_04020 [Herbaspirillum rubrisubalbicans]